MTLNDFRKKLEATFLDITGAEHELPSSDFMAVAVLSHVLVAQIGQLTDANLISIFTLVEEAVSCSVQATKGAATTAFLENLQNRASAGKFPFQRVAPFLGPSSREFCLAWDQFTGIITPGLRAGSG